MTTQDTPALPDFIAEGNQVYVAAFRMLPQLHTITRITKTQITIDDGSKFRTSNLTKLGAIGDAQRLYPTNDVGCLRRLRQAIVDNKLYRLRDETQAAIRKIDPKGTENGAAIESLSALIEEAREAAAKLDALNRVATI